MNMKSMIKRKILSVVTGVALLVPGFGYAESIKDGYAKAIAERDMLLALQKNEQRANRVKLANTLLTSKPTVFDQFNKYSIISANEWHELQLNDLISTCCKPETSFGFKGLQWLLNPITDMQEIIRRQTITRSLVEDKKLFTELQALLQEIEKNETAVLMYWDKQDTLMYKFTQFYYSIFPRSINKDWNKSPLKLNLGVPWSVWMHSKDIWQNVFLAGFFSYTVTWLFSDRNTRKFSAWELVRATFSEFYREFDPRHSDHFHDADKTCDACGKAGAFGNNTAWRSFLFGTAGDRYVVFKREAEAKVPVLAQVKFADIANSIKLSAVREFMPQSFKNATLASGVGVTTGIVVALGLFVYSGLTKKHDTERAAVSILQYWVDLFTMRGLLKQVASFIRSLEKFEKLVGSSSALSQAKTKQYLNRAMNKNNWSTELRQLSSILEMSMFDESKKLFLPGHLFAAHTLMQEVKSELVPAMQAVAEFDGYLALAKFYNENQNGPNRISFVEFVSQDTPMIELDHVWTPFVGAKNSVSNPVSLGAAGHPTRMLITGPNGGGKSIYFTALGQAVVMAHAWGIAPAQHARMTVFNQIRTSFAPQEDKLNGISKFMAQKRHISGIEKLISGSSANNKMLVLLDEPFDGTTEHLMAERVYDFGCKVKQLPHVVVGIATHVKKPVELGKDGSFSNYHVGIEEPVFGTFTRTFKLEQGPARWWFEDQARGARYQDWLDVYMQQKATAKTAVA